MVIPVNHSKTGMKPMARMALTVAFAAAKRMEPGVPPRARRRP